MEGSGGRLIGVESAAAARYVYVVDDDSDLRASLEFLLRTKEMLVLSFSDPLAFLKKISALAPGPILLDVRMPQMNGVQLLAELVHRNVNWPVIFLTGHGELSIAVSAFKLGAADFLEKPVSAVELEECLERAFDSLGRSLATTEEKGKAQLLWSHLSRRETEVISGLCEGLSNKQVAFNLSISPRTVEMHRANALRTLGVRSLAEVVSLRVKSERQY